jgi:hypothetical protein
MEPPVLKTVIEYDKPAVQPLHGKLADTVPIRAGQHGDAREMASQEVRLVSGYRRLTEQSPTIGDDDRRGRSATISPQNDGDTMTPSVQSTGEHLDERGLSRAASDQIAYAQYRDRQPPDAGDSASHERPTERHRAPVDV